MSRGVTSSKPFKPGTTGWTASDLDDPRIEGKWLRGSYEIVQGVLTRMPPDLVIDEMRVAKADAVWMTPDEQARQADAARRAGRQDPTRARILVPPSIVIESLGPGHERHDRDVKRKWYAEFGVSHYWLLDAYERTLELLVLRAGAYEVAATARDDGEVLPPSFPGLAIPLGQVWMS
jgi:Uma2 family endonuclease